LIVRWVLSVERPGRGVSLAGLHEYERSVPGGPERARGVVRDDHHLLARTVDDGFYAAAERKKGKGRIEALD
jgi:hypothetical protein